MGNPNISIVKSKCSHTKSILVNPNDTSFGKITTDVHNELHCEQLNYIKGKDLLSD